jgi:hypothetical protein
MLPCPRGEKMQRASSTPARCMKVGVYSCGLSFEAGEYLVSGSSRLLLLATRRS